MKILGIETADRICAVALMEDNQLIKEEIIEDANTHSVKLMPLVDKLLKETNTKIEDIDLFACDIGPGSFTGIRIGVSTIKAFLDVTNKKAIGISSLEILANNIQTEKIVCSLIDAKNQNVYCGFFRQENGIYQQIGDLTFETIEDAIKIAKNKKKKIIFVGNGSIAYQDMIKSEMKNEAEIILEKEKNKLNARNIAKIAYYKKQESVDSNHLIPMYLRKSNAERQCKK